MHAFSVAWTPVLLDSGIKGAVILVLAAGAVFLMRRASAALLHAVWLLAIISVLFLPALSIALPGWHILPYGWSLNPQVAVKAGQKTSPGDKPAAQNPRNASGAGESRGEGTTTIEPPTPPPARTAAAPPAEQPMPTSPAVDRASRTTWSIGSVLWWFGGLWAIGTFVLLVRAVLGQASLWGLRRSSNRIMDERWISRSEAIRSRLGVSRSVVLLQSDRRRVPMVLGIFRSSLLLPSQADAWPEARCRAVLMHELGHIKRWDCLAKLLTQVVCALYWLNPLV
ncbi:MAG: M56 family metallopeptidase [Planctomycetota bacterium]|nr:M56 family metallopeptidase [Planctomycetota bacterium]